MVVQLLQPVYLWGLLGLLVPLIIHLLHKRSRNVFKVGSLQAFRGGEPVQARRLRPNELLMLLLRCLLLLLFVLLLCKPVLTERAALLKNLVFIAPELASQTDRDSLLMAGFEARVLQPGLPLLQEGFKADSSRFSYWDVFREIEQLPGLGDTVFLKFYPWMSRFLGDRPSLSRQYKALPVKQAAAQDSLFRVIKIPGDKLLQQRWSLEGVLWKLRQDTLSPPRAAQALAAAGMQPRPVLPDTLNILLQFDAASKQALEGWKTALQLIDSLMPEVVFRQAQLTTTQVPGYSPDLWVWLAAAPPPPAFEQNTRSFRLSPLQGGGHGWFRRKQADLQRIYIEHSLEAEQHNRARLAAFLPELHHLVVELMQQQDEPPLILLAEAQWQPQRKAEAEPVEQTQKKSLEAWLWLALIIVFMIERWLSIRK